MEDRPRKAASTRDAATGAEVLPAAVIALVGVIALAGPWQIWPAILAPLVLAQALGGERATTWAAACAGFALVALGMRGGPAWVELAVGFAAATGAAAALARLTGEGTPAAIEASGVSRDRLTGLATRAFLVNQMQLECTRPRRGSLSLVLFDLDRFAEVNTADGRATGDRLLALIGAVVTEQLAPGDVAARIGSDEIAVMHIGGARRAREIAEQLRAAIAAVEVVGPAGHPVSVTASAGVAEFRSGDDVADVLDRADDALLAAKRTGRDRVAAEEDARRLRSVA